MHLSLPAPYFCSFLQVAQLMMLDCKRAVPLFIQNRDMITPSEVVSQLMNAHNKCDSRYFLHLYLHALFEVNPHSGRDFHDMQVCLDGAVIFCVHYIVSMYCTMTVLGD